MFRASENTAKGANVSLQTSEDCEMVDAVVNETEEEKIAASALLSYASGG